MPADASEHSASPPEESSSDLFARQEGRELEFRALVSVGDLELGTLGYSQVRDEAGLKLALVRIGDALNKRIPDHQDALELQQVLDGYHDELGRYMDGEVEVRGPDWKIGVEVGPAPPQEEWWVPKADPPGSASGG